MESQKISAEEIAVLREKAILERQTHQEIMEDIKKISSVQADRKYCNEGLSVARQMEIIKRGNKTELKALLEAYAKLHPSTSDNEPLEQSNLCEEAQLWFYHLGREYTDIRNYFLKHNRLCFAVEKEIIDKGVLTGFRYSLEGEKYLITSILKEVCQKDNSEKLVLLESYTWKARLKEEAEVLFVTSCLSVHNQKDSVIDSCCKIIKSYIDQYGILSALAEEALVALGAHELILDYIRFSIKGLQNPAAVEKLIERANREEITAYYNRYATL